MAVCPALVAVLLARRAEAGTWGLWHAVPYAQAGNPASWVLGQILFSMAFRVLIVELTGGPNPPLLGAVSMHATYNIAWQVLLHLGTHYSPWATLLVTGLGLALVLVRPPDPTASRHRARPD